MPSSEYFTKEETERVIRGEFRGLGDALDLMQKRKVGRQVVGRWDWHLWMFLISTCLPCFGVYCLAMWVRAGLWEEHYKREELKRKAEAKAMLDDPMQKRLSAVEKELSYLRYLLLLNGTRLPLESMKPSSSAEQKTSAVESASSEKRKTWSDRVWDSVKKWLPFYVEPYFPEETEQSQVDLTGLLKPQK